MLNLFEPKFFNFSSNVWMKRRQGGFRSVYISGSGPIGADMVFEPQGRSVSSTLFVMRGLDPRISGQKPIRELPLQFAFSG
jgi:hypothetical protein